MSARNWPDVHKLYVNFKIVILYNIMVNQRRKKILYIYDVNLDNDV